MRRPNGTLRDWIALALFIAAGVFAGRAQTSARDAGKLDSVSGAIQKVVAPSSKGLSNAFDTVSDFFAGMFQAPGLKREVARLRAEVQAAALYQERVDLLSAQIDELRALNGLGKSPGRIRIPASVIGYIPRDSKLTLDVGSESGVVAGLAVVMPEGMVGIVTAVGNGSCQVALVTTARLKLGAMIQRSTPSVGLIEGSGGTLLSIELNDPKADAKAGDLVVTSGLSEKIPRGIIIGRVVSVEDVLEFGQKKAVVFPTVNLGKAREVVVLR